MFVLFGENDSTTYLQVKQEDCKYYFVTQESGLFGAAAFNGSWEDLLRGKTEDKESFPWQWIATGEGGAAALIWRLLVKRKRNNAEK